MIHTQDMNKSYDRSISAFSRQWCGVFISSLSVNEGLDSLKAKRLKALYSCADRDKCSSVHYTAESTSFWLPLRITASSKPISPSLILRENTVKSLATVKIIPSKAHAVWWMGFLNGGCALVACVFVQVLGWEVRHPTLLRPLEHLTKWNQVSHIKQVMRSK